MSFKKGDSVICISKKQGSILVIGGLYTISFDEWTEYTNRFVRVESLEGTDIYAKRFILASPLMQELF